MPASLQDRDGLEVLTTGKANWPGLRPCLPDGAFTAERCREWCNLPGRVRRVIGRDPEAKGFEPVFKRWLVERSFGALRHGGGLLVDRAGSIEVSTGRLACVAAMAGLEALINPVPVKMTTNGPTRTGSGLIRSLLCLKSFFSLLICLDHCTLVVR